MPDAAEFVKIMKKAAVEAIEAKKPAAVYYGTVLETDPLQIQVEQKMTLGMGQLVLTRNVTNYTLSVAAEWETDLYEEKKPEAAQEGTEEETELGGEPEHTHKFFIKAEPQENSHFHKVNGTKITINNALRRGEEVILLRVQEGQKYIVLDRIGVMT